jgi:hypothetical protein
MRILRKILLGALLLLILVYGSDELYARFRSNPFADVHIDQILAVHEKFNKIDYERTDPTTERCVYAIFPHLGHNPCWYVMGHTTRIIDIG